MASAPPISPTDLETPLLTVEDLAGQDLPEAWELVEGRLIELPPSGGTSSRIGGRSYSWLLEHGERRGLGWAYPADAGFILFADRRTVRSPDAAFVLIERLADPRDPAFVAVVPDLVVEVLSPSDRMSEALAKVAMYLRAGVRLLWQIDPVRESVTVFTPDSAPVTLVPGAILDGGDILPDFRMPVADIFAP